jgi:hypothetical protein
MVKVKFACTENMNSYEEDYEFEDDITDEEIAQEFSEWVWQEVGDNYYWKKIKE